MDGAQGLWESVAREVHDDVGTAVPVDAFEIAVMCGLRLEPGGRGHGSLDSGVVRFDVHARPVRQHGIVAHEVAHFVLRQAGVQDTEQAASYTAGALLLPRETFDRQLRDTAWNLDALHALHPNASFEMIARRIAELRDAVITVIDQGRVRVRVGSPWMSQPPRLTHVERELADAALVEGVVQRRGELFAAHPVIDDQHRRVIVVAEARQLGLRF